MSPSSHQMSKDQLRAQIAKAYKEMEIAIKAFDQLKDGSLDLEDDIDIAGELVGLKLVQDGSFYSSQESIAIEEEILGSSKFI